MKIPKTTSAAMIELIKLSENFQKSQQLPRLGTVLLNKIKPHCQNLKNLKKLLLMIVMKTLLTFLNLRIQ
jgi:hypothetical protein